MRNLLSLIVILATLAALFATLVSGLAEARAARSRGDDPGCKGCLSRAASLFAGGQTGEAADLLRSWSKKCPGNSQLHLLLSTVLMRLGPDYMDEAEQAAAAAVAAAPGQVATHFQYGIALMANDRAVKASQQLERVVELEPGNYDAWQALAGLYGKMQEPEKADNCAKTAAGLEPASVNAKLGVIRNLKRQGKLDRARDRLRKLIESESTTPELLQKVASLALSIGAFPEALTASQQVIRAYPNASQAFSSKAMAEFMTRDYQSCLHTTSKMLSESPANPVTRSLNGLALLNLDQPDKAKTSFTKALNQSPDLSIALFGMGSLQFKQGDLHEARKSLTESLANKPEPGIEQLIYYTLGQTSEKEGKVDDSLEYYRESLLKGLGGKDADSARQAIKRLGGIEYSQQ